MTRKNHQPPPDVGPTGWRFSGLPAPIANLRKTALDVDVGKLIKFERGVLAQFSTFARETRLFGVRLRDDRHIFAGRHRHGAGDQPSDACNQHIVLGRSRRGNTDNQACGRNDAVVGSEHRGPKPPNTRDEVTLRVRVKTAYLEIPAVRSKPTHENQNEENDQNDANDANAAVTEAVPVSAEAAAKTTQQEDN